MMMMMHLGRRPVETASAFLCGRKYWFNARARLFLFGSSRASKGHACCTMLFETCVCCCANRALKFGVCVYGGEFCNKMLVAANR